MLLKKCSLIKNLSDKSRFFHSVRMSANTARKSACATQRLPRLYYMLGGAQCGHFFLVWRCASSAWGNRQSSCRLLRRILRIGSIPKFAKIVVDQYAGSP